MMIRFAGGLCSAALVLALLGGGAWAGERKDPKEKKETSSEKKTEPDGKKNGKSGQTSKKTGTTGQTPNTPGPVGPTQKKTSSDPKALALFQKAVKWQGRDADGRKVMDFSVDQLHFKAFGKNEVEGDFRILHSAPDKIWFKVWTPTWWRAYCTNGKRYWWLTGAMSRGWEKLSPENPKHSDKTDLIDQALRIVRLIFLENFLDGKTTFRDYGLQALTRRKGTALTSVPGHLVKCERKDEDSVLFFLDPGTCRPLCIVVHRFVNVYHPNRDFFIHLDGFKAFNGVQLPTKIRMHIRHLKTGSDQKFLYCDLVESRSSKIRVNKYIPRRQFEPRKRR
jgi:hypothetical protein